MATARIYITARLAIEHGAYFVDERGFPGRQGRVAFAFLIANRHRTVSRDDLMSAVWTGDSAAQNDAALDVILSKLRAMLKKAGWPPDQAGIDVRAGTVTLRLPMDTWVDIDAAANALDEAEGALRRGDGGRAWSEANVVVSITRRPFLADHEAPWIEARRNTHRLMLARALQCLSVVSAANHEPSLAVDYAAQIVVLDPFRESGYQQLMRVHAAAGDRAEALRVFARCRELFREELGVSPSAQTESVYLGILRTGPGGRIQGT